MINPSDISADTVVNCYTFHASVLSGVQTLAINPDRSYTLAHDGLDIADNTDVSQIIICTSGLPLLVGQANVYSDTVNPLKQLKLTNGRAVGVGPGLSTIRWIGTAKQPTFAVISSERLRGNW